MQYVIPNIMVNINLELTLSNKNKSCYISTELLKRLQIIPDDGLTSFHKKSGTEVRVILYDGECNVL